MISIAVDDLVPCVRRATAMLLAETAQAINIFSVLLVMWDKRRLLTF